MAKYIKGAYENIKNQTYKDIEIIFINDASNNETSKILDDLAKSDKRISVYTNNTNLKLGYCRNLGIEKAKGEFITFVDVDDLLIDNNFFEDSIKIFEKDKEVDFVYAKSAAWKNDQNLMYGEEKNIKLNPMNEQNIPHFASQFEIKKYLLNKNISWIVWSKVYRKTLFKEIKFTNSDFWPWQGSDTLIYPLIILYAKKIVFLDKFVYLYNIHPESDSYSKTIYNTYPPDKAWEDALKTWWTKLFRELSDKNILNNEYSNLIIDLIKTKYKNTILANDNYINENFILPYKK